MSLFPKLKKYLSEEFAEPLPWMLMAYIVAVLGYFCCQDICMFWVLGIGCVLLGLAFLTKKFRMSLIIVSFCVGWLNIAFQTELNQHPVLDHPIYQAWIEANVLENQALIEKQILTLNNIRWSNASLKMPQKIRVHFKRVDFSFVKGDKVKALVSVYPPSKTFSENYERQLWFQQIGGTGIAQDIILLKRTETKGLAFSSVREKMNRYLFSILLPSQAEIAAPLITGGQKLVRQDTYRQYRRAGIAHVLSVSGFHMALLAAFLFFIVRGVCALFPRIVLFWNSKKIAAAAAFVGTFLYLGVSGFQIPAVRAFIMISFVFAGILVNRSVFSMRSLWLAGFGILLVSPERILSASFQLSFVAVMILVAFYSFLLKKSWNRCVKVIVGFVGLNVLVFLTLIPFVAYHFHQIHPYGFLGNMLFNGVFSFFIMPLLFAGVLLMPIGADKPFFWMAGWGIEGVRLGVDKIAGFPAAEINVLDVPGVVLGLFSFGMMLLCFLKTPLKNVGYVLVLMGIAAWLFS